MFSPYSHLLEWVYGMYILAGIYETKIMLIPVGSCMGDTTQLHDI